jgi:hypothetical protein
MQIASFILVHDRRLKQLEDQLEELLARVPANLAFINVVPGRLQEMGREHPISIPVSSLGPLDQAAGRQRERLLSGFEDPSRQSRLGRMANAAGVPLFYVSPPRVREFAQELANLSLVRKVRPEDVQSLLGRRITEEEMPAALNLLDAFRHDLYQVYRDAADQGKGVIVLLVTQSREMDSAEGFPRAA